MLSAIAMKLRYIKADIDFFKGLISLGIRMEVMQNLLPLGK